MAFFQTYLLTFLIVFSSLAVSSWRIHYSLHDLLQIYGLPKEIFPTNVRNYSLDENNVLEVKLESPCLTKFESTVYFESTVQAHLSKGKLSEIQGLSNKELFIWLPVKGIIVNYPEAGLALIDITLANKTLSLSVFEKPLICEPQGRIPSQGLSLFEKGGDKNEELGFGLSSITQFLFDFLDF